MPVCVQHGPTFESVDLVDDLSTFLAVDVQDCESGVLNRFRQEIGLSDVLTGEAFGKLNDRQKQLLRDFAESEDARIQQERKGFFDKLKDLIK